MSKQEQAFYAFEHLFYHYSRSNSTNMPKAHFHETYEIYYLIEGRRRFVIDGKIYDLSPGDIVLIPQMVTHLVINIPGDPPEAYHARHLISSRRKDIPDVFLKCFDTNFYHLSEEENKIVVGCFEDLQNNQQKDEYTPYHNQANLIKILHILAKHTKPLDATAHLSERELCMQDAATYIKENCSLPISLNELAKRYSFTKEYFSTIFKEATGLGVNEYLNQMRISKAMHLLISTDDNVIEISKQCGFNDSNYFSVAFKKITNATPTQFRHMHKK